MSNQRGAWLRSEFGWTSIETQRSLVVVTTYSLVVGFAIALSGYHDNLNADTIMVYLAALVRWTPFFWGQDRYGMAIPALVTWITSPFWNIVVQNGLHVACTVASFFLLARVLFPESRWKLVGSLGLLAYLSLSGLGEVEDFLTPWQIYTPAMMFALAAILVTERRLGLGLSLACLGAWCNFSVFLLSGAIVFARAWETFGREGGRKAGRELWRQALVIGLSALFGNWLRVTLAPVEGAPYAILPDLDAIRGWVYMVVDVWSAPRSSPWILALPPAVGLMIFGVAVVREWSALARERLVLREFFVALTVALGYALVVGSNSWAKFNGFPRRYLIPSLMIWVVAWAALGLSFLPKFELPRWARGIPAVLVLLVAMVRFGTPWPDHARASLAAAMETPYSQVPAECTHVAGDYYRVWKVVLYSRLVGAQPLWGLSYRREVTVDLWDPRRFARPVGCFWVDNEPEGRHFLNYSGFSAYTDVQSRGLMKVVARP